MSALVESSSCKASGVGLDRGLGGMRPAVIDIILSYRYHIDIILRTESPGLLGIRYIHWSGGFLLLSMPSSYDPHQ